MADSKISQLTAITAVDLASTDVLPIVDTSATTTKKVAMADVAEFVAGATVITSLIPGDSDDLTEGTTNLYYTTARSSLKADLASPTFTGTPAAPTAAADTNTTQIATTGYVVGQAASATPLMDNTAAVGTSLKYARQDHIHPVDTSRAPLASPALTGTPTAPTAADGTNTTQVATTAFVQAQSQVDQFILASAIF